MSNKQKITGFFKPVSGKSVSKEAKADAENDPGVANKIESSIKRKFEEVEEKVKEKDVCVDAQSKEDMHITKARSKILKLSKEIPLLTPNIGQSWYDALEPQFEQDYFRKLSDHVTKERESHTIFPSPEEVWSWTTKNDIKDTKVVILGQDPYHGPGQAHGLCFSVKPGVASPPSLVNIYKELVTDIPGFETPGHGYLGGWADQGVLLLNACLTVRKGEANSHKGRGWEKLTDAVVKWISINCSGVVFLLWGLPAQKKAAVVDGTKHYLLKSVHPSPLSAYRGFLGCRHFSQCNKLLEQQGKDPIDWTRLSDKI